MMKHYILGVEVELEALVRGYTQRRTVQMEGLEAVQIFGLHGENTFVTERARILAAWSDYDRESRIVGALLAHPQAEEFVAWARQRLRITTGWDRSVWCYCYWVDGVRHIHGKSDAGLAQAAHDAVGISMHITPDALYGALWRCPTSKPFCD